MTLLIDSIKNPLKINTNEFAKKANDETITGDWLFKDINLTSTIDSPFTSLYINNMGTGNPLRIDTGDGHLFQVNYNGGIASGFYGVNESVDLILAHNKNIGDHWWKGIEVVDKIFDGGNIYYGLECHPMVDEAIQGSSQFPYVAFKSSGYNYLNATNHVSFAYTHHFDASQDLNSPNQIADNVTGFYSNIITDGSHQNVWNFYAASTAPNYFKGDTTFDGMVIINGELHATGPVIDPQDLTTKAYVDGAIAAATGNFQALNFIPVNKNGDTMTGELFLANDPTMSTSAATKNYVDNTTVLKTGSTMTGPLVLSGNPTTSMHAATKSYVDSATTPIPLRLFWNDYIDVSASAYTSGYTNVKTHTIPIPNNRSLINVIYRSYVHHVSAGYSYEWRLLFNNTQVAYTQTNATDNDNIVLPIFLSFNSLVSPSTTVTLTLQVLSHGTAGNVWTNGGQNNSGTNIPLGQSEIDILFF